VLSTVVGGNTLTLASQPLTVTSGSTGLTVSTAAGSRTRLLVYYSCQPGWHNGLQGWAAGQHNYPCFEQRRATLATYLDSLGVSYTLVKDEDTFTKAMRTGQYNNYWLVGALDPIHDTLSEELREAVNRGDSLLIDGGNYSWSNHDLYHLAGVYYEGHLNFNGPVLNFSVPVYADLALAGTTVNTDPTPVYFKVVSGSVSAWWAASHNIRIDRDSQPGQHQDDSFYQQNAQATQYPGIVSGAYGQGKTLAVAFDLVGSLQDGNASATPVNADWKTVLADSLSYEIPAALSRALLPGEVFTSNFALQSQGAGNSFVLYLQQPTGGSYVGASLPGSLQGDGRERFSLTLPTTQGYSLLTDQAAPATPGSYNLVLSAQTDANPPTVLGSYSYAFTVGADQGSRISTVSSELQAITVGSADRGSLNQARTFFNKGVDALNHGQLDQAVNAWADASSSLASIAGNPAAQARADLDLLLKQTEAQWAATH
jgi:hypothetical protein